MTHPAAPSSQQPAASSQQPAASSQQPAASVWHCVGDAFFGLLPIDAQM
jgi:hypothetical protein